MPWRMIGVLILLGLVAVFATLNLENRADISFGFYTFTQIPVYLSLLLAFIIGSVVMIPFTLVRQRKKLPRDEVQTPPKSKRSRKGKDTDQESEGAEQFPAGSGGQPVASKPRGLGAFLGGGRRDQE